jgi:hypothetical protein
MMEERKMMLIALFFVTVISIAGFAVLMKSSSTSFAWGNIYADQAVFKNCFCHNGEFVYTRANNGISGPDVRFLGQLAENQCNYDCWKDGYSYYYWERPVRIA